jgi:hypothetical protein
LLDRTNQTEPALARVTRRLSSGPSGMRGRLQIIEPPETMFCRKSIHTAETRVTKKISTSWRAGGRYFHKHMASETTTPEQFSPYRRDLDIHLLDVKATCINAKLLGGPDGE